LHYDCTPLFQGVKDLQGISGQCQSKFKYGKKKPQRFYMNLFVKLSNFCFVFHLSNKG
jgi:hypothetical protein